jgi:hypothetical protein
VEVVARYSIHYPLTKFTCKKVEDRKTDVSTLSVPRPDNLMHSQEDDADPMQIMNELNTVRGEIIRRHYGQPVVGKVGE